MKIRKLFALIITLIAALCCALPASASIPDEFYSAKKIPETRQKPRLVDDADILSDSEEEKLLKRLDEISERDKVDVVIVTIKSLGNRTPMEYADDYYDYNGFGFGPHKDGFVLLLAMNSRDRWFSGTGYGIQIYTDYGQEQMWSRVTPKLSAGNYYGAFETYANISEDYIRQAKNGKPYDAPRQQSSPNTAARPAENQNINPIQKLEDKFFVLRMILMALGGGAVIAFIYCTIVKRQLISVSMQHGARDYFREGSFELTDCRDTFMYKDVSKVYIPPSSSSGSHRSSSGGTRTHRSSSGSRHSGSGGKF